MGKSKLDHWFFDKSKSTSNSIDGDNNIVLQNINNSKITIGVDSYKNFIKYYNKHNNPTLNILILHKPSSGQNISDWKPFGEKSIMEIILKGTKLLAASISVYAYGGTSEINDEVFFASLKIIKRKSILVIDNSVFDHSEFNPFSLIFNDFQIGGCITIPNGRDDCEQKKKERLNHLEIYRKELFEDIPSEWRFQLSGTQDDYDLMRAIRKIAASHLGIKCIEASVDFDRTLEQL